MVNNPHIFIMPNWSFKNFFLSFFFAWFIFSTWNMDKGWKHRLQINAFFFLNLILLFKLSLSLNIPRILWWCSVHTVLMDHEDLKFQTSYIKWCSIKPTRSKYQHEISMKIRTILADWPIFWSASYITDVPANVWQS